MNVGKPGRGADQFPLRLPDGMRDRIKERASANNRSMNAEIVSLLEESLIDRAIYENEELRLTRAARQQEASISVNDRLEAIERQLETIIARLDK